MRRGTAGEPGTVMLKLIGRADATGLTGPVADDVWRVCLPGGTNSDRSSPGDRNPATSIACLLRDGQAAPTGYGLYLIIGNEPGNRPGTPGVAGSSGSRVSGVPGPVLRL